MVAVLILVVQSSLVFHGRNKIMKVHPVPWKRNISIQFGSNGGNPMLEAQGVVGDH